MANDMKHTPGPWDWFFSESGGCYLATPHRGRLIVMDFIRRGMQGGTVRFATWDGDERANMGGIMRPAHDLDVGEHPDARLIAAAPDLLAALLPVLKEGVDRAKADIMETTWSPDAHVELTLTIAELRAIRAAIARATS